MLLNIVAVLVALIVLVAFHEWGHYRMARACGVKVLTFSVGFGKALFRWRSRKGGEQGTEFVIAAVPLGGYVRMLDEHDQPVAAHERHLAFNTQPLRSRAAIVVAGPLANWVLAVLLFALVALMGMKEPQALLPRPVADSLASQAGLRGGEQVLAWAWAEPQQAASSASQQTVASFTDLRWHLLRAAVEQRDIQLTVRDTDARASRTVVLALSQVRSREIDMTMLREIGITGPLAPPVIERVSEGGAAERAGLMAGDRVNRVGSVEVVDAQHLIELIRASVQDKQGVAQTWQIARDGKNLSLEVQPAVVLREGKSVGQVGAQLGGQTAFVTVQYSLWDSLAYGWRRSWESAELTLRVIVKMVLGEASLKNISGPVTVADVAGKSAHQGLQQYLGFLAAISIGLAVLNLLPLPFLDGGHLMYYLWEGVSGRAVSQVWLERLQRLGLVLLALLIGLALYNDIVRLFA